MSKWKWYIFKEKLIKFHSLKMVLILCRSVGREASRYFSRTTVWKVVIRARATLVASLLLCRTYSRLLYMNCME